MCKKAISEPSFSNSSQRCDGCVWANWIAKAAKQLRFMMFYDVLWYVLHDMYDICMMMSQLNHMSNHFHRFPPGDKADETIDIQKESEPSSGCATYHLVVSTLWVHKHQWQLISDMPMLPMRSSYDVHNMLQHVHISSTESTFHFAMTLLIFVPLWQLCGNWDRMDRMERLAHWDGIYGTGGALCGGAKSGPKPWKRHLCDTFCHRSLSKIILKCCQMLPIINSIQVIPVDSTLFAAVKNLIQVRSFQGAGFIVKMSAQNELACARPSVDLLPSLTVWKSLTAPQQFGMNTAFFLIFLSGACLNPSKYADFDVETGSGGKPHPTWHLDSNGVMRYVCCMRLFWYNTVYIYIYMYICT